MSTPTDVINQARLASSSSNISKLAQEGIIAGALGAAVIAVWFLILDTINGRPLYTPTVLGAALFRAGDGLATPQILHPSLEMVLMYTWVHGMVFCVLGGGASWFLGLAERNPHFGFGILLLFVVLEFGFLLAVSVFAQPVLGALAWPAVLIGNLLAAIAMAAYLWHHHPDLIIRP